MSKYSVTYCGGVISSHEALIEAMVEYKRLVKKYGFDNVDILRNDNDIQTIKIILVKED